MSENPSEQEPSIEEILASIRQIISDDDEEEVVAGGEEEVVENPISEQGDDVLELTEADLVEPEDLEIEIEEEMEIEVEMVDREEEEPEVIAEPEPEYEPEPEPEEVYTPEVNNVLDEIRAEAEKPKPMPSEILSSNTQSAALGSLSKLSSRMPINRERSYDGITLEDIVREQLHPMLREWMDDNLPRMVERLVQKELEKLARRAMDD